MTQKPITPVLFFLVLILSATNQAFGQGVNFTFNNQSKWKIDHLYISAVNEQNWGPDQLEKQVIEAQETFTIKNVVPGTYDIKIVDEDGDECTVEDVSFTVDQAVEMTDEKLVACQAATKLQEKQEGETPNEE